MTLSAQLCNVVCFSYSVVLLSDLSLAKTSTVNGKFSDEGLSTLSDVEVLQSVGIKRQVKHFSMGERNVAKKVSA